jgi:hypothetical protein
MNENTPKPSAADARAALEFLFPSKPAALPALPPPTDGTDDETLEIVPTAAPELKALRTQQRQALEILTQGGSYAEAAKYADVTRKTLYNWVNKDATFQTAMQAWRDRVTRHAQDRLVQAVNVAAQTLGRAAARDVRAAVILLKGQGLLSGQRPGASQGRAADPAEAALAELRALPPSKRQAVELRLRELILSFREEPEAQPNCTNAAVSAPNVAAPPSLAAPQPEPTNDAEDSHKLDLPT